MALALPAAEGLVGISSGPAFLTLVTLIIFGLIYDIVFRVPTVIFELDPDVRDLHRRRNRPGSSVVTMPSSPSFGTSFCRDEASPPYAAVGL